MTDREKFEKWATDKGMYQSDWGTYWTSWQAAISTRKPWGFGIVDKDGKCEFMRSDFFEGTYQAIVDYWNESEPSIEGRPFRVVELFYEDQ